MGKSLPTISVLIATYNSHNVLPRTLEALRNQSYPEECLEIFAIDGGSTDDTAEIARLYGCIVLDNPQKDPGFAKMIGLKAAHGRYLVTLDHDEVIENEDDIMTRVKALMNFPECKVALLSGYKRPDNYPGINEYISEFGDPFSMFNYRHSMGYRYLVRDYLKDMAEVNYETDNFYVLSINHPEKTLLELMCFAVMIDFDYFREIIDMRDNRIIQSHAFYMMCQRGDNCIVVAKDDPLVHYSADSIGAYLPKLRYRIINNVHYSDRGDIGFRGRERISRGNVFRKYLFVPYVISTLLPILDGLYLSFTRRNLSFFWHPVLCWYVLLYIIYQYIRKFIGVRPKLKTYDGKDVIPKE